MQSHIYTCLNNRAVPIIVLTYRTFTPHAQAQSCAEQDPCFQWRNALLPTKQLCDRKRLALP